MIARHYRRSVPGQCHCLSRLFILWFILLLCHPFLAKPQEPALKVLFYNVENLFDTINDPLTADDEFTPSGEKAYGTARYEKKLFNLATVLSHAFEKGLPDVVGLAEVENEQVLKDLISIAPLKGNNLHIIHHDSPDKRGIDVAFLYNPDKLKVISSKAVPVELKGGNKHTRDILHVHGKVGREDFHFFVNHWPSRAGGKEASEEKRLTASQVLLAAISAIPNHEKEKIIVMGDLNDLPEDKSVRMLTRCETDNAPCFVNLHGHLADQDLGTYYYKGNWEVLDQMLVSPPLLTSRLRVSKNSGKAVKHPWMMYTREDGTEIPDRTYGRSYFGGYSDHLPVSLIVYKYK